MNDHFSYLIWGEYGSYFQYHKSCESCIKMFIIYNHGQKLPILNKKTCSPVQGL